MGKPRATVGAATLALAVFAAAFIGCTTPRTGDGIYRRRAVIPSMPDGETTIFAVDAPMPTDGSKATVVDTDNTGVEPDQDCPNGQCGFKRPEVQASMSGGDECYRPPAKRVITPLQEEPAMCDTASATELVVRIPSNITLNAWIVGLMAVATLGFCVLLLRNVKVSWRKGS